ncbi:hypothetical protein DVH05_028220 [Phytophthora capsici]|nr:hypothetical protein DVH05_028220 [Phytophthora capsici]
MGSKKRRRSESFQAEQTGDDDARKRLAAFHERMFDLPQEKAAEVASEMPRVVFKSKHKKRKHRSGDVDDDEPMPVIKFNKTKVKKEKKQKKKNISAAPVKQQQFIVKVAGQAVKVPGKQLEIKNKPKKVKVVKNVEVKIEKKKDKKTFQAPQWHSMTKEDEASDDVDLLEQALGSMKEIAAKQTVQPLHKKPIKAVAVKKEEKLEQKEESAEKKHNEVEINDGGTVQHLSKNQQKKKKKKMKALKEQEKNSGKNAHENTKVNPCEDKIEKVDVSGTTIGGKLPAKQTGNHAGPAPSPKSPSSRKKRKKSPKVKSVSPNHYTPAQPRQGKPLVVSDEPDDEVTTSAKAVISVVPKTVKGTPANKTKTSTKATVLPEKVSKEEKTTKLLTPIAASLAKDAKKKNDMFLSVSETSLKPEVSTDLHEVMVASKRAKRATSPAVIQAPDSSSASESDDDGGFDFGFGGGDDSSLFSRLIDSAARERWELIEVGRLVRLFSAEWNFKENKTAQFLEDTCPELVSVDFLEGLGVNLSAKQLIRVFEAGSGNSEVLVNKMASAVENGHLSVHDADFVSALERRVALMESNGEVMQFLHPLLESLSTVRDVGCLLKKLCEHWQLERKMSLVQQVLLSNVFDDLDGNQDEILEDLPDLTGRLDFPSRLDQEDVDENGNLKGFLVNDDSEYSGEEGSEEDDEDEIDSEADENPYEGESDSDEEVEITGRSQGRNQFIEDEVEVGEEDEEEEEEQPHSDAESSSSDSD